MTTTNGTARRAAQPIDLQRLFERMPPQSIESEMCLLGSMILDPKVTPQVQEVLAGPEVFVSEPHRAIYETLVAQFEAKRSHDLTMLGRSLSDRGALNDVGGLEYLVSLADAVSTAVNAPHHARVVRACWSLRALIAECGTAMHAAYSTDSTDESAVRLVIDEGASRMNRILTDYDGGAAKNAESLTDILTQVLDRMDRGFQTGEVYGLPTGLSELDHVLCGLQPGEFVVVGARPSMGKTAFALSMVRHLALGCDVPVGFVSLEMTADAIATRLVCMEAGVSMGAVRRNMAYREDIQAMAQAAAKYHEKGVIVGDRSGSTVTQVRAMARRWKQESGIRALFVDYLQLLTDPSVGRENRTVEVGAISRGLKALARELDIPVVCLSQLNRGVEGRSDFRPRMADLRESGAIEQDADSVILLHREEYYHQHDEAWKNDPDNDAKIGTAEVIVAKNRNGECRTITVGWDAASMRFWDRGSARR